MDIRVYPRIEKMCPENVVSFSSDKIIIIKKRRNLLRRFHFYRVKSKAYASSSIVSFFAAMRRSNSSFEPTTSFSYVRKPVPAGIK
jgi:hypothetical protein